MSRLIVKNLPKSITVDKLKDTFSSKGTITDVQLKYTKDGKFRQFGFVGYKSEEEGKAALEYFNNTYLNASKITVELCADLGDPSKPKSWSKYASDSTAGKAKTSGKVKDKEKKKKEKEEEDDVGDILEKHKDDPLFVEYMETHLKSSKAAWSNDMLDSEKLAKISSKKSKKDSETLNDSGIDDENKGQKSGSEGDGCEEDLSEGDDDNDEAEDEGEGSEDEGDNKASIANKDISDFEYLQKLKGVQTDKKGEPEKSDVAKKKPKKEPIELFTVKIRGLGFKARKSHVRHFFHPLKPYSIRLPPRIKGIAYVGFRTEKELKQALGKNKGFLAGRQIMVNKYEEKDKKEAEDQDKSPWNWKNQEESLQNEETIGESGRIFVRNLAYTVTMEDVEQLFAKYGPLVEVNVPVDWMTRKPKGFGTITFMIPEHAVKAYSELDGKAFHGRMLHLLPGKAKPEEDESLEGLTYKQKKEKKLKNQAKSTHNWNTLFLGHNAVADAIAREYDTTKEKVLDSSSGNSVAVRLALGETQLVSKTREFLLENGVSLSAFDQATKKRSKTILLVKNLPAGTEASELREIFDKHALLGRVVLPPSGLTAIIEFSDPTEARYAFRKLAYTKFKNLPLYLEWAPEDTFTTPSTVVTAKDESKKGEEESWCIDTQPNEAVNEDDEEEDEEPEADATLFVKNLNFETKEEDLIEHFKKCGKIHSATIAKKKDARRPGELLSMGFGFVQFMKKASAEKALKTLQNSSIDGHSVELKRSNRAVQSDVATARKKSTAGKAEGSKILVRNIPFEATVKEVTELFQTFGDLKSVRLPKKLVGTGSHRGFGFVEFLTKADAKQAFKALSFSTHLYGRRLVLEWASNEENVEELRKRTADHFIQSAPKRSNKSVLSTEDVENE
ncbi:probable RNA-binding protein 19 [Ischnura elegans]|uniref:probable RNA-binding protein 19 n=1 Tax=Ischnura elegans TaxID=197161 RepID=UPI001ED8702E|nr:probable RNA-binding protein 19 [Ischnura elegans]